VSDSAPHSVININSKLGLIGSVIFNKIRRIRARGVRAQRGEAENDEMRTMERLIRDMLVDRGLRKSGQAEASGDFRLQEAADGGRQQVPSSAEPIRERPRGTEYVQQERDGGAGGDPGSQEEAETHEPAGRAVEGGHCDEGGQTHQGGVP